VCGCGCIDPRFLDLDTSWWVVSFTPRPLYPLGKEAGWAPEPVWTTWRNKNSCPYLDSNSDPSAVQPVASLYTDCAIPALFNINRFVIKCNKECGRCWNSPHMRPESVRASQDFCYRQSYSRSFRLFHTPLMHKTKRSMQTRNMAYNGTHYVRRRIGRIIGWLESHER
jgi:hypothetical protein